MAEDPADHAAEHHSSDSIESNGLRPLTPPTGEPTVTAQPSSRASVASHESGLLPRISLQSEREVQGDFLRFPGSVDASQPPSRAPTPSEQLLNVAPAAYPTESSSLGQAESWGRRLINRLRQLVDLAAYKAPSKKQTTARTFSRHWQRTRILLNSSARLFITQFLCSMCAVVLKCYKAKGNLSIDDSRWFHTLMTVLQLCIGLNYRSSLQNYVKLLRWWILARWDWPLRQFDLILEAAQIQALLKLIWESRGGPKRLMVTGTQVACFLWILLNLAGAVGIAILGLTYNLDQGSAIFTSPGKITVLNLENQAIFRNAYFYAVLSSPTISVQQGNSIIITYNSAERKAFEGLEARGACTTSSLRNCSQSWDYHFLTRNPSADINFTSTSIISAESNCKNYTIVDFSSRNVTYQDQDEGNQTLSWGQFDVSSLSPTVSAPNSTIGRTPAVTFVYDNTTVSEGCNESQRCARIYALFPEVRPKKLYICTNRISNIINQDTNGLLIELPDDSARALAASIAYSEQTNITPYGPEYFKRYTYDGAWAVSKNPLEYPAGDDVASTIAQFSLTALAAVDQGLQFDPFFKLPGVPDVFWRLPGVPKPFVNETHTQVNGPEPYRALGVVIQWGFVIAILCAIPLLQLSVLLAVVYFANDVFVKDDSPLCTAKLLAPVVQDRGEQGSLLTADELLKELGGSAVKLRYGWTPSSDEDANCVGVFALGTKDGHFGRFPGGLYV